MNIVSPLWRIARILIESQRKIHLKQNYQIFSLTSCVSKLFKSDWFQFAFKNRKSALNVLHHVRLTWRL